jgi:hypothetical protein
MPAPVLDLSGPALRRALESLVAAAESSGGVEAYVRGIGFKVALFGRLLNAGRVRELSESDLLGLCSFMPTVRRRVAPWLADHGHAAMRTLLTRLIEAPGELEARFGDFIACFADDRRHRWVRDLAAEVLHFTAPEQVPLMTRWMWDARTTTGVLREIWYDEGAPIDALGIPDRLPTFLALRTELDGFLRGNGVFRDLPLFQDLLCAHIYAGYINDRGSSYLKGDFAGGEDPMNHTRRLLGLDALDGNGLRIKVRPAADEAPPWNTKPRIGH